MEESNLNRNRFFVGCEIKSISFVKATMYYMQQNDLKDEKWEPTNVVGMKFFFRKLLHFLRILTQCSQAIQFGSFKQCFLSRRNIIRTSAPAT